MAPLPETTIEGNIRHNDDVIKATMINNNVCNFYFLYKHIANINNNNNELYLFLLIV